MKICVLGSGSSGNAIYVADGDCGILVDAGLSRREILARLGQIGVRIERVAAVLLSHEHEDHVRGVAALQRGRCVPVHLNRLTAVGLMDRGVPSGSFRFVTWPIATPEPREVIAPDACPLPRIRSAVVSASIPDVQKNVS